MIISLRNRQVGENVSLFESDRFDVSLSSNIDSYPDSKLKTDNLDDYAMAWGQRRSHTRIMSVNNEFEGNLLSYVAVLGINRSVPSFPSDFVSEIMPNQARLVVDDLAYFSETPQVLASGYSLTNLVGDYSILNQIVNPPEQELVGGYAPDAVSRVSNSADTSITLLLGNNSQRPLRVGANLQEILIHVRDSVDSETVPALTVAIRQNGSDVDLLPLLEREKTSVGYIFRYLWDASILPSLTLPVGLTLHGDTTGTSTTEYFAVAWNASVTGALYDSGWSDLATDKYVVWTPNIDLSGALGPVNIMVEFNDFAYRELEVGNWVYIPLASPFHAGRFVAGSLSIRVPVRSINGYNLRRVGSGSLLNTYGGQFRVSRTDLTRWQADITITPQSHSRMFGELGQFVEDVGFVLPALYVPDDNSDEQHSDVLWAVISSFEAPDAGLLLGSDTDVNSSSYVQDDRYDTRMSILEIQGHITRR